MAQVLAPFSKQADPSDEIASGCPSARTNALPCSDVRTLVRWLKRPVDAALHAKAGSIDRREAGGLSHPVHCAKEREKLPADGRVRLKGELSQSALEMSS